MLGFLKNFQFDPDPEMADVRRLWRTTKPIFKDAVVAVAPPYPDYPKLKVSKRHGPESGPSCPSARDASSEMEVLLYTYCGNGFDSGYQERAWEFLLANAATIEIALRRKLFSWHKKTMAEHHEENLPDMPEWKKYWQKIEKKFPFEEESVIDQLFKLVGVGLADSGLDECGFSSFEFQTGWDRDHGLGVLMHRDRVLAAGGMCELIYGTDLAAGARAVQSYDLDDGDFSLQNS
ncbi:MAG: DUF6985 domain-containing protein [Gemmataceae bacterium]